MIVRKTTYRRAMFENAQRILTPTGAEVRYRGLKRDLGQRSGHSRRPFDG
jgi:hypothetical protein